MLALQLLAHMTLNKIATGMQQFSIPSHSKTIL